jgi:4'-phosphopantetheinyl transferase
MPVELISSDNNHAWLVWKVTETETELAALIEPFEPVPENLSNLKKRLEFLAGRVALKMLLANWQLDFKGLTKDIFGKPFFQDHAIHLSLTHSYPFVAAIINRHKRVGIDLEQPKEKMLAIAPRVLHQSEQVDAGTDLVKHCIYWCAKESLIKVHGKKDLVFAKNLQIEPFTLLPKGELTGRIVAADISETIPMLYHVYDTFVLVITT